MLKISQMTYRICMKQNKKHFMYIPKMQQQYCINKTVFKQILSKYYFIVLETGIFCFRQTKYNLMNRGQDKTCVQGRFNSACTSMQFDQCLHSPLEEAVGPSLPTEPPTTAWMCRLIGIFSGCTLFCMLCCALAHMHIKKPSYDIYIQEKKQ